MQKYLVDQFQILYLCTVFFMTYANGKRVTSVTEVQSGDRITTAFKDGSIESITE